MNDYFIPSVGSTAMNILLAYFKDKLPDKEVHINYETGDVTVRSLSYVQQDELTNLIDIINKMD